MSAASPAQPQVRRPAAATTRVYDFSKPRGEDEIRVNLADVPVMHTTMDVDVFEPTLLSRLFDLFGPRR
ncbi:hypothetical protein [Steroidobacter cummioxidans]|uniref:hypothetical protein n=1 Tax=Steroidobacter cummioxidans TaxID=1803913 RepID=UPI000E31488E|nr:hypothetical protein [Steroidobacter cummioxidans]